MAKKRIQNCEHDAKTQDGKDTKESLVDILGNLLLIYEQRTQIKGLDNFRRFNKISRVFSNAKEIGIIELEEEDYKYLLDIVTEHVPASWGINPKISEAIEKFIKGE